MFKAYRVIAIALFACGFGSQAFAQGAQGCIVLKSTAEIRKEVVDEKGVKTTKMVPAEKVVPGTEVTWTVTANNICKQPSDKVTINNAVPAHMSYVADSASGAGSDITFSLDGAAFAKPAELTVKENGATRVARADEYKHIRWVFKDSLAPGATASASFRAVLN
ncbi:MAG TPA: hypothetical protein VFS13_13110 [Steroidobacteraceae bacterium]|jgi:uncharacterized repeat protein (TIGR01451 family)|nr:hypothetical protein [Steroidobacteraceae bacterium]